MSCVRLQPSDWLFSPEELSDSPSRDDGLSLEEETAYRRKTIAFIHSVGTDLGRRNFGMLTVATAAVLFNRFFAVQSFKQHDRFLMSYACLWLAGKVEEKPRELAFIILTCERARRRNFRPPKPELVRGSEEYKELAGKVLRCESELLQAMAFDFKIRLPYKLAANMCIELENQGRFPIGWERNDVQSVAVNLINDSFKTSLCLRFLPEDIANAAVYMSCTLKALPPPPGMTWDSWSTLDEPSLNSICREIVKVYDIAGTGSVGPALRTAMVRAGRIPARPEEGNGAPSHTSSRRPSNVSDRQRPPAPAASRPAPTTGNPPTPASASNGRVRPPPPPPPSSGVSRGPLPSPFALAAGSASPFASVTGSASPFASVNGSGTSAFTSAPTDSRADVAGGVPASQSAPKKRPPPPPLSVPTQHPSAGEDRLAKRPKLPQPPSTAVPNSGAPNRAASGAAAGQVASAKRPRPPPPSAPPASSGTSPPVVPAAAPLDQFPSRDIAQVKRPRPPPPSDSLARAPESTPLRPPGAPPVVAPTQASGSIKHPRPPPPSTSPVPAGNGVSASVAPTAQEPPPSGQGETAKRRRPPPPPNSPGRGSAVNGTPGPVTHPAADLVPTSEASEDRPVKRPRHPAPPTSPGGGSQASAGSTTVVSVSVEVRTAGSVMSPPRSPAARDA